jgi:hypothetical protein
MLVSREFRLHGGERCCKFLLTERLLSGHVTHIHVLSIPTVSTPAFARVTAPKMSLEGVDMSVSNIASNANLIAASVEDNGGFFFPIVGLALLAATILFLSPPLADE